MHRLSSRAACAAVGATALLLSAGAPAVAAPLERERYSGSDSFSFDECGFVIDGTVDFEGLFMLKAPKRAGDPPRLFDNYNARETLTAEGSDRFLTIDHQGLYKDLKITKVEGTIYQFVAIEAGKPFVIRDEDGTRLVNDRGMLKTTFQVDTKGDTDLSNDVFVEGSHSLVKDAGRHPGYHFDFCEFMEDYFFG